MRFYLLLALVPAAAFGAASLASAAGVAAAWPALRGRIAGRPAAGRARALALLRLLPIAAASILAAIVLSVFLRYEPRDTTEGIGVLLLLGAGIAALLWGRAIARVLAAVRAGRESVRLLRACARPVPREDGSAVWVIDTAYPVAAVLGVFRTRLLLSSRIVRECTAGELESVIRHEAAHIRRRDNVIQAAMRFLPDPLPFFRAGREMQQLWALAAEEAADDEAAGTDVHARAELAAALVRVARMADGPPPRWMPALAFFAGTNLESRVRRLLREGPPASGRAAVAATLVVAAAVVGLAFTNTVGVQIHGLMELAVNVLP